MTLSSCQAHCVGDQMICETCVLAWDLNDPDPPACNPPAPEKPAKPPKRRKLGAWDRWWLR